MKRTYGEYNFRIAVRILGIIMLGLLLAGSAQAATLTVCKSGCAYSGIQDAVDAASSRDTIQVQSGTYFEHVNLTKQLTLRGIGMPVVDAGISGSAITLLADGITLEGFTTTGGQYGIYLSSSSSSSINNNKVAGTDHGIKLESSNNNMLNNNSASGTWDGFYIRYSSNNTFRNNTVHGDYGFFLISSSYNNLTGNNASHNVMFSGITLVESAYNNLNNNIANSNGFGGIYLVSSSNNTLSGNNASNNDYGIFLDSSSNNIIYNNYFNNTINYRSNSINNIWNTKKTQGPNIVGGPYLGGNFWAKPDGKGFSQTCRDKKKDGICDMKYNLDSENIDYLPLSMNYMIKKNKNGK